MTEIIHIFRKDVHSLWAQIIILLLLFAGHAYFDVRSVPIPTPDLLRVSALATAFNMLLPLGIFS